MLGAASLLALAATGCDSGGLPRSSKHALEGREAPPFRVRTKDGREVGLPASADTVLTVVDFWAVFCEPCVRALPELEKLHRAHGGAGVQLIGVNIEEEPTAGDEAAARAGTTFAMVRDVGGRLRRAYTVRSLPMTFLVDRQGMVRWSGHDVSAVGRAIQVLLAEARGDAGR